MVLTIPVKNITHCTGGQLFEQIFRQLLDSSTWLNTTSRLSKSFKTNLKLCLFAHSDITSKLLDPDFEDDGDVDQKFTLALSQKFTPEENSLLVYDIVSIFVASRPSINLMFKTLSFLEYSSSFTETITLPAVAQAKSKKCTDFSDNILPLFIKYGEPLAEDLAAKIKDEVAKHKQDANAEVEKARLATLEQYKSALEADGYTVFKIQPGQNLPSPEEKAKLVKKFKSQAKATKTKTKSIPKGKS